MTGRRQTNSKTRIDLSIVFVFFVFWPAAQKFRKRKKMLQKKDSSQYIRSKHKITSDPSGAPHLDPLPGDTASTPLRNHLYIAEHYPPPSFHQKRHASVHFGNSEPDHSHYFIMEAQRQKIQDMRPTCHPHGRRVWNKKTRATKNNTSIHV